MFTPHKAALTKTLYFINHILYKDINITYKDISQRSLTKIPYKSLIKIPYKSLIKTQLHNQQPTQPINQPTNQLINQPQYYKSTIPFKEESLINKGIRAFFITKINLKITDIIKYVLLIKNRFKSRLKNRFISIIK